MLRVRLEMQVAGMWQDLAPSSSLECRQALTEGFLDRGATQDEVAHLFQRLQEVSHEERDALELMISGGFLPEQVVLFAQSTSEERIQLAKSWLDGTPAHQTVSRIEQGVATLATIKLGSVAVGSLVVLAAGLALQSPAIIETSAIATGLDGLLSKDGLKTLAVGATQVGFIGAAAAFSTLLFKCAKTLASEVVREPVEDRLASTQRDLEDRVAGAFRRMGSPTLSVPGGSVDVAQALKELSAIPAAYLPLLTHLHPKELVMFLSSEEDARSDMMLRNAPTTEQRVLTGRALASGRLREFSGSLQQTLSSWEGGIETTDAVTLGKTMTALRQARQEKRQAGTIPAARPRFGSATP